MVCGNPFGSPLPQLTDDAGTPFAVVVIPVDDGLAVGSDMKYCLWVLLRGACIESRWRHDEEAE